MLRYIFRNAIYPTQSSVFCLLRLTATSHFSKQTICTSIPLYGKRAPWEPWEDKIIHDFITQNGPKYKELVEHCLPHRTANIVDLRWNEVLNPDMKRGGFSKEELETLRRAVAEVGEGHWSKISKEYLPQRTPRAIRYTYYYYCAPLRYQERVGNISSKSGIHKKPSRWTPEEDRLLLQGYEEFGRKWTKISDKYLPHRYHTKLRDRYDEALDPNINRKPWTDAELDLLLRRHIMYGEWWPKVAEGLDGRTARACERKWIQSLEHSLNSSNTFIQNDNDSTRTDSNHHKEDSTSYKGEWSGKETKLFWHLACAHDCHWSRVAKIIGRNRMACSHKFYGDIEAIQAALALQDNDDNGNDGNSIDLKRRSDENKLEWKQRVALQMRNWFDSNCTFETHPSSGALFITDHNDWTDEEIEALKRATENKQKVHWSKVAVKVGKTATRCRSKYNELHAPKLRRGRWTLEDDEQLLDLINMYGTKWKKIAEEINKNSDGYVGIRGAEQCRYRWNHKLKYHDQVMVEGNFSKEEKALVQEGVHMFGKNWAAIQKTYLPHRTPAQCMRWWSQYGQNTGNWTQEEDERLRFAIKEYGEAPTVWKEIADLVLTRTPTQCRKRWCQSLNPNIKSGPWPQEEQMRLAEVVQTLEEKSTHINWNQVADELGTKRSPWDCRNKYANMVKTGNQFGLRHRSNKLFNPSIV